MTYTHVPRSVLTATMLKVNCVFHATPPAARALDMELPSAQLAIKD